MNQLHSFLSQGALDDLTRLEQRAEQLAGQQGAICEQLTQLQTLQAHVGELRARRDRLKAEQATRGAKGPLSLLASGDTGSWSKTQRALLVKRHGLEEKKTAYRLMGRSVTVVDRRTLRLCFDTSCGGEQGKPQYVELQLTTGQPPVITRHTLPAYVPLDTAKTFLKQGLPEFMNFVQQHLQAYQIRKKLALTVQEQYSGSLGEPLQLTPSGDWLTLSLAEVAQCGGATVLLQLKYDDLTAWLPTRVKVTVQGEESEDEDGARRQQEIDDIVDLFKTTDLRRAVHTLVG